MTIQQNLSMVFSKKHISQQFAVDFYKQSIYCINKEINIAIEEMNKLGIKGKETTPYLLDKIQKLTGGESLEANIRLVLNNAMLASKVAVELNK